jgi:transposase
VNNWLKRADIENGIKPGVTDAEHAELRAAKRRIRLLEHENGSASGGGVAVAGASP